MTTQPSSTEHHSPGRRVEVVGRPDRGTVLLWHGLSVDHGSCLLPLAHELASRGLMALAVDWDPTAGDRGRSDLLSSVRHARETTERHGHDPDDLVVLGWSLGGTAAASLAVHSRRLGIDLGGVVLVAPAGDPQVVDPLSGSPLPHRLPRGTGRCRVDLVYGTDDTISPPDTVSGLELRMRSAGWTTRLHAVDADHGGVVGARHVTRTERYVPSDDPAVVAAMRQVADVVDVTVDA